MTSLQRPDIGNSHVPLAFLLGPRARDYRLPALASHHSTRHVPIQREAAALSLNDSSSVHVRRREAQATRLLERVLANESRLDTNQKYEPETPLDAPLARVSTADRRKRAVELQRVLKEREVLEALAATATATAVGPRACVQGEGEDIADLYDQRERFAATHGFVPRDPDFVEVVGSTARIQRAQSLRQFHDDEKLRRAKQFRAKQSRRAMMQQQLQIQQATMKTHQQQHSDWLTSLNDPHDACDEPSRPNLPPSAPKGADAIRIKQATVRQWQDEQQRQLKQTKQDEQHESQRRHEAVQRARRETEDAVKARLTCSQFERKTMAKIKGVGPSFQSTLRVEDPDNVSLVDTTATSGTLMLGLVLGDRGSGAEEHHGNEIPEDGLRSHLQARQYEQFRKSQPRSLHLGGGFASKPHATPSSYDDEGDYGRRQTRPDDEIVACANAVPLTKSKRQVQDEWKRTLGVQH